MFRKRIPLFRIFGFDLRIHASWFVILVLISWSLARGLFPSFYPAHSPATYWAMGIASALGLFASIVLHELCHSLVARKSGMEVEGITLFLFGGVSELHEEPRDPSTEFLMAAVGPLFSLVLAFALYGVYWLSRSSGAPEPTTGVLFYLCLMNFALAVFNLLPAFPLDGGRVLRSILWKWRGDLVRATRIASRIGILFGLAFVVLGIFSLLSRNIIGGIWWFMIGLLLQSAASETYQQLIVRRVLGKMLVRDLMDVRPMTVPASTTLSAVVQSYFPEQRVLELPVVDHEKILGMIRTKEVKTVPRAQWDRVTVGEKMIPLGPEVSPQISIGPESSAAHALQIMRRYGNDSLLVVQGDTLVGSLSMSEIIKSLSMSLELGGELGSDDLNLGGEEKPTSPNERKSA